MYVSTVCIYVRQVFALERSTRRRGRGAFHRHLNFNFDVASTILVQLQTNTDGYIYWVYILYILFFLKKRQVWDRGFHRNSSLQAAWDISIARTTGFMWPHQERKSLLRGTKSDSCGSQWVYKYAAVDMYATLFELFPHYSVNRAYYYSL